MLPCCQLHPSRPYAASLPRHMRGSTNWMACMAHSMHATHPDHTAHLAGQQAQCLERLDCVSLAAQQACHVAPHLVVWRVLRVR